MDIYEINHHYDAVFARLFFRRRRSNCSWSRHFGDVFVTAEATSQGFWISFEQHADRYSQSILVLKHDQSIEEIGSAIYKHLDELDKGAIINN